MNRSIDHSSASADNRVSVRTLGAPTRREIEALAEIFDQYRAHYGEETDTSGSVRWLVENLNTNRLRVFVAEDNGQLVGFAITIDVPASLRLAHFWQIRDLFVLPTYRRLGVGRTLLASVRAAAAASGALRLALQTEDDNNPALRLYADSDSRWSRAIARSCCRSAPNLGRASPMTDASRADQALFPDTGASASRRSPILESHRDARRAH